MPVKAYQLPAMPQLQDKTQARLQQAEGWSADVIDELLLSAGNDIRAPEQQPRVDQRQGQQETGQAVGMAHAGKFQAKAAAVVFEIFKHFLNPEPLGVALAGEFAGGFSGNEIPGLGGARCPIHIQDEVRDRRLLCEGYPGPTAPLAGEHQGQHLKVQSPGPAHLLVRAQPQAHAPALLERPLRQHARAKLPVAQQQDPGSWGQPTCHHRHQLLLLRKTRRPAGHQPPQQRQSASPPSNTNIPNVKGAPLRALQGQMHPRAAGHQPAQKTLSQGLVVSIDTYALVLEKALHALLEAVAGAGHGQGRDNLAHLQALTAQEAQGHGRQIHQPGRRFLGQVTVQLVGQVGKHFVLWFDHYRLRGRGCSLRGYDRSQPALRRLFLSQLLLNFYCPLVRCRTTPSGRTVCSNGQNAAAYNPKTGAALKSEKNQNGVTTTQSSKGGQAKTKNGMGVYKAPNGATCVKTKNSKGCK